MDLRRATALAVAVVSACTSAPQPEARPDAPPAVSAPTPAGASAPPAARASLETERSLAASITDATERLQWPSERGEPHVQHTVPLVQHVTLRPAGTDRWEVVGAAGAIPNEVWRRERRHVRVMATEWRSEACVESRQDGSFGPAAVEAGPGMTIYVMPVGQENCTGSATGDGALVLRTPEGVEPGPTMAFAASGAFEGRRWIARGELLGAQPRMTFTVPEPLSRCLAPVIHVHRLFDGDGEFVTGVNSAVHGPVLTPTGLSIETGQGPWGYWARFGSPAGPCLRDGARLSLAGWTSGLLSGWYRPRVALYERGGTLAEEQGRPIPAAEGFSANVEVGYLPFVGIGDPKPAKIPVTFLNEDPSWGSAGIRGIQAREDQGRFALGSRRAAQGPFIASPHDPLTGGERSYVLEPFLPTVAYTGFGDSVQRTPLLAFADPAGSISVTLTGPDGAERDLAREAPVRSSFISARSSTVPLSFAGPNRTFGLITGAPGLSVRFTSYGRHTLAIRGALRTIWGQELQVRGTYELWVAEPLQLSIGTFQGTPLEVGQQYSPAVSVRPGVPAEITVEIDHYVDGDAAKRQTYRASGQANEFGYFVARERWRPSSHGEYLARITASYIDPIDDVLWMATRTGASIVATPDGPLTAHGQRNERLGNVRGDGAKRTWFFNRALDPQCGEATCESVGHSEAKPLDYPYHRGDVAWLADVAPMWPAITLEGPAGALRKAGLVVPLPGEDATPLLPNGANTPDQIESWTYWYSSTVRPDDVSIFHVASDASHADHQQWYGNDTYNCQIGLTCFDMWGDFKQHEDRAGDEEGDIKVFFGGAVLKSGAYREFVPYASMGVIIAEALQEGPQQFRLRDEKGQRICPPYQGAAGGLATCGPLLTVAGVPFDLFVTPTGTRPGSILRPGDRFVFSGLVWPTLEVAYDVTVRAPSGTERIFSGRASRVGYIDGTDAEFEVTEAGVHTVHVRLRQDRVVPSTGLAPDPALVADGATVQTEYAYGRPLSAIFGSAGSTYEFFVGEPAATAVVSTEVALRTVPERQFRVPSALTLEVELGDRQAEVHYTLGIPGLVIRSGVWRAGEPRRIELDEKQLYDQGFTNVILGADSLDLSVAARVGGKWLVKAFNLRGLTPFGGAPVTFR